MEDQIKFPKSFRLACKESPIELHFQHWHLAYVNINIENVLVFDNDFV